MFRRRYLVTVGAIAVAGCAASEPEPPNTDTSSSTANEPDATADGPESPVVHHYEALDRNDFEAANDAIHSESSRAPLADDVVERARTRTYDIDSIELSDADTPTPVVAVEVTETDSETGDTQSLALRIEVKKDGDVWKMHRIL